LEVKVKVKVKWQVRLAISFYTLKHKAAIRQLAIYRVIQGSLFSQRQSQFQ
jgi:hypothetical protein